MANKITRATFKSFLKKNAGRVLISTGSRFDGMYDSVMPCADQAFTPIQPADRAYDNNLGYQGVWLVLGSRDYFTEYSKDGMTGIQVYNCCGTFTVAVKN